MDQIPRATAVKYPPPARSGRSLLLAAAIVVVVTGPILAQLVYRTATLDYAWFGIDPSAHE